MPCNTRFLPNQTITERKAEIKTAIEKLAEKLAKGTVKAKVGPQGAIAFVGWLDTDRSRVTDNCAFRRIMATGSAQAKLAILKAEQMAGRSVNKQVIAQGAHSHDGTHWHNHKG
jgi:hypothetical protein